MADFNKVEVFWHQQAVQQAEREAANHNKGCVVWFTGLSASGKSTIANIVDHKLFELGKKKFRFRRRQCSSLT